MPGFSILNSSVDERRFFFFRFASCHAEAARSQDIPVRGGWTSLPGSQAITHARKTNGKCMTCEHMPACLLTKDWPIKEHRSGMPTPVFLYRPSSAREQQYGHLPRLKLPKERVLAS